MLLWQQQVYILHIHLINIQHSIYHINHVQSVYIFRYTPATFGSLFVIYPLAVGPREISQINSSQQVYI